MRLPDVYVVVTLNQAGRANVYLFEDRVDAEKWADMRKARRDTERLVHIEVRAQQVQASMKVQA